MRETQLQPITGHIAYFKEIIVKFDYCTFTVILIYLDLLKYLDIAYFTSLFIFTF